MNGSERRQQIVALIRESESPVSGQKLASMFSVSRQVIVQDIALIRASGHHVFSTNRGYLISESDKHSRIFKVNHSDQQLEEELYGIVDLGGCVENVMVNHKVYGQMEAALHIDSRRKALTFIQEIQSGKSSPLKNITSNYHYHTVSADSEEILDEIETMLKEKNILVIA